jgi:hypothetical protein
MGKRQALRVVSSPEGLNNETGAPLEEGPRPRPQEYLCPTLIGRVINKVEAPKDPGPVVSLRSTLPQPLDPVEEQLPFLAVHLLIVEAVDRFLEGAVPSNPEPLFFR